MVKKHNCSVFLQVVKLLNSYIKSIIKEDIDNDE